MAVSSRAQALSHRVWPSAMSESISDVPYPSGMALVGCFPTPIADIRDCLQEQELWTRKAEQKGPEAGATWYSRPSPAPGTGLPDLSGCYSPRHPGLQVCEGIPSVGIPFLRPGAWPARVRIPQLVIPVHVVAFCWCRYM